MLLSRVEPDARPTVRHELDHSAQPAQHVPHPRVQREDLLLEEQLRRLRVPVGGGAARAAGAARAVHLVCAAVVHDAEAEHL